MQGFEKFYGFIGGETNQWFPEVFDNLTRVEVPSDPSYHFTEDMTTKAIDWIKAQKAIYPDKPFFIYWAPGATHAPHQVAAGVDREVQGPVRRRLGCPARAHLCPAEGTGRHPRRRRADPAPGANPGLGRHAGGAEAGPAPPDGDLRRLPRAHRPLASASSSICSSRPKSSTTPSSTTSSATTAPRPKGPSTAPSTR